MKHILHNSITLGTIMLIVFTYISCTPHTTMTRGDGIFGKKQEAESEEFARFDGDVNSNQEFELEEKSFNKKFSDNEQRNTSSPQRTASVYNAKQKQQYAVDQRTARTAHQVDSTDNQGSYGQNGLASWYGREFHGRKTASGENFDMYAFTAAHKTLPFGTVLQVKNLENGKTVKVRINDRGPYKDNRVLDLSYVAARELGMLAQGEAMVSMQVLQQGATTSSNSAQANGAYRADIEPVAGMPGGNNDKNNGYSGQASYGQGYRLQAGAFYSTYNAQKLKRKLEGLFTNPVRVIKEGDLYKVQVHDIYSKSEAKRYQAILEDEEIATFIISNE